MRILKIEFIRYFPGEIFVTIEGVKEEIRVKEISNAGKPGELVYRDESWAGTEFDTVFCTHVACKVSKTSGCAVEFRRGEEVVCRVEPRRI